jgi:thioredoxin 1
MDKIQEIDNISKTKKVTVMVGASWCGPCKLKKPTFLNIKEKHPDIHMEFVDSDDEAEFKKYHGVKTLPTFISFVDGQEVGRMEGAKQTMAQLEEFIVGQKAE